MSLGHSSPRARSPRPNPAATVALRKQVDLPPLPAMYSTGLMACYAPLIYLAMRLRTGDRAPVTPMALRSHAGERVSEARERAVDMGIADEDIGDAELVVIALLDSAAQTHPGELREFWAGRTLEFERYGTATAGHTVFERLTQLTRRGKPEVLELYQLALATGFEGEKRDRPQDIRAALTEIQRQLSSRRGAELLSPRTTIELPPLPPEPRDASPWAILAASMCFVLLLGAGSALLAYSQARDVGRTAETLSQMLGPP